MNHRETECDAKCKQYPINAQYTISIDHPEKKLKGENCMKAKGRLSGLSPLRSDGSRNSQAEAGPHERWPKAFKTKLNLKGNYKA
jgi:hypothetical protein